MRNTKENELIYEAYVNANKEGKSILQEDFPMFRRNDKEFKGQPEQVLLDDGEYKVIKINSINSAVKYSENTQWALKDRRMARGYLNMNGNMFYISKNGQPIAMALVDTQGGEEQVRGPNNEDFSEDPKIRNLINKAIQNDDKLLFDPRVLQDLF